MIAYGYEVKGWKEALADVQRNLDNPGCRINWNLFKTGDTYNGGIENEKQRESTGRICW